MENSGQLLPPLNNGLKKLNRRTLCDSLFRWSGAWLLRETDVNWRLTVGVSLWRSGSGRFFLGFPTPKRREPKTRLLGQLGDISPKCFKSSVTISEEAPGSGSLQRFTISRDGGQAEPKPSSASVSSRNYYCFGNPLQSRWWSSRVCFRKELSFGSGFCSCFGKDVAGSGVFIIYYMLSIDFKKQVIWKEKFSSGCPYIC